MKIDINSGFTLFELIVTLAIVGILAAITLPNMRVFILNARVTTQANELLAELNNARGLASKLGAVVVCPSSNPDATSPSCSTGNSWETGWIAFADKNGDLALSSDETVISRHSALEGGNTLRHNQTWNVLTYNSDGSVSPAPSTGTRIIFSVCDDRGVSMARGVTIEGTGRAASVKNTSSTPLTCP